MPMNVQDPPLTAAEVAVLVVADLVDRGIRSGLLAPTKILVSAAVEQTAALVVILSRLSSRYCLTFGTFDANNELVIETFDWGTYVRR